MRRILSAGLCFVVLLAGTSAVHAAAPALVLDYPKGGETFVVGTMQTIRVNPKTKVTPITIALSRNGPQGNFTPIATVTPSKTTPPNFNFVVNGQGSGNCVIKVSGTVKGVMVEALSGTFQIVKYVDVGGGAADITTNNLTVNGTATVNSAGITDYGNLSVSGDVKLGASGQFFAPGGEENLRIIRGVVDANASIQTGSGFTVARTAGYPTGNYTITFTTAFSSNPAVTVAPVTAPESILNWTTVSLSTVSIRVQIFAGAMFSDQTFSIIAIGGR